MHPRHMSSHIPFLQGCPHAVCEDKYEGSQTVLDVVTNYCKRYHLEPADCQLYFEGDPLVKTKFLCQVPLCITPHDVESQQHLGPVTDATASQVWRRKTKCELEADPQTTLAFALICNFSLHSSLASFDISAVSPILHLATASA